MDNSPSITQDDLKRTNKSNDVQRRTNEAGKVQE